MFGFISLFKSSLEMCNSGNFVEVFLAYAIRSSISISPASPGIFSNLFNYLIGERENNSSLVSAEDILECALEPLVRYLYCSLES